MKIDDAVHAVDDLMVEIVASDIDVLQEASRHIILAGGKRVRPRVLFYAYQAAGGTDLARAIPLAAAIELVHTATLVHDDINDHGRYRRGRATINEQWGRTFALLTGDFLFAKVYELMAPYGDLNVTFAEATVALVEGETLQAAAVRAGTLNRETYQQIVAKKTASLFRASAMLGAQLAGADRALVDTLGEYGFYLGLLFQIVDDLLDLTGDPRLMGKAVGVDVVQGKGVAAAMAGSSGNGSGTAYAAQAEVAVEEADPFLAVRQRLIDQGAITEGHQMAHAIGAQAHATLEKLPQGPAVEGLRGLVELVLERDH